MKEDLLNKITKIILHMIGELEKDIKKTPTDLQDKKNTIISVAKLFPMILKIEQIQALQQRNINISTDDLKIIDDFLRRKGKSSQ
jgi:hypothetical protein